MNLLITVAAVTFCALGIYDAYKTRRRARKAQEELHLQELLRMLAQVIVRKGTIVIEPGKAPKEDIEDLVHQIDKLMVLMDTTCKVQIKE